jgi:hypothetical protein
MQLTAAHFLDPVNWPNSSAAQPPGNPVNLKERRLRSSEAASASPGWRVRQR